jgi:hypothetical protein
METVLERDGVIHMANALALIVGMLRHIVQVRGM